MEDISFNCDQYTGAVMGLEEMKCVSNDLLSTAEKEQSRPDQID